MQVVDAEPHPHVAEIMQQIDVAKVTTKKVRRCLNLKTVGFDSMEKLKPEVLRSYFGEYSPSAKAYKTHGGRDEVFQEVAKFMFEVAFVSPRFYGMPKQREGFIVSTYEGEIFD